jgi:hypothetical protein
MSKDKKAGLRICSFGRTFDEADVLRVPFNSHNRYRTFDRNIRKACRAKGVDYNTMPFLEVVHNMADWLTLNQAVNHPLFQP